MRYHRLKQKWIGILFGVYTAFTLLLWSHENGGIVSVPTISSGLGEQNPPQQWVGENGSLFLVKSRVTGTWEKTPSVPKKVHNTKCPKLPVPVEFRNNEWQRLPEVNVVVYAANFDPVKLEVRVIAARDKRGVSSGMVCHVWGQDGELQVSRAFVSDLPEQKGKRYSCSMFQCKLEGTIQPRYVSLSTEECKASETALHVNKGGERTGNFTVCVTPLNFNYSKAFELVEMIELNRILGASHFVFYNYSTNKNVDSVLAHYKRLGIVEVLPWNLPMSVDTWPKKNPNVEIHYFAQIAALNDCLQRNRLKTRFIVYQDLDEFIIPRKVLTWDKMFESLPPGKAAYMFRNTFFRKEWPDVNESFSGKDMAKKYKAVTLLKQNREAKIFTKRHRSKYIIDPTKVEVLGIHTVQRFRSSNDYYVEPNVALMHHYRDWENPADSTSRKYDNKIMEYKDKLLQSLKDTWSELDGVELGPLPF